MVKVRFIKYHPQFAHDVGDEPTLLKESAELLIEGGYAVEIDGKENAADKSPKEKPGKDAPKENAVGKSPKQTPEKK